MPRAKKVNIVKKETKDKSNFVMSNYQTAIYDTIEHTPSNIVIKACAGAGKTTTIIKALDLIPATKKVLFIAFNTDIVKDIKEKVGTRTNVEIRTLHSLGYKMIAIFLNEHSMKVDSFKYISYIQQNINSLTSHKIESLKKSEKKRYIDNVLQLVNFGRFNLCQTIKDMTELCKIYGIDCVSNEKEIALKVMTWGKNNTSSIDFTDMVWLPIELHMTSNSLKFDFIFLDESQDSNMCEFELIQKTMKMGSRLVIVGDSNQSIYSFAGSSPKVMEKYENLPNTVSLPLSICYRCPKKVIEYVNKKFPDIAIEAAPDAKEGQILYDKHVEDLNQGDTVLCRTNAPLMSVYVSLLKQKKQAFIKGKDIGDNLIKIIKRYGVNEINRDMNKIGLISFMYADLFDYRDKLMVSSNIDCKTASDSGEVAAKLDIINTIEILSEGTNSIDTLIDKIKGIFSDKNEDGITLSTVHKAKGLTMDNVYICCPSLFEPKKNMQDWEIVQERNLEYVCYTRAKNTLAFMSEEGFKSFINGSADGNANKLKAKEITLTMLTHRIAPTIKVGTNNYKDIIKNASKIKLEKINTISSNNLKKSNDFSLSSIGQRKKKFKL